MDAWSLCASSQRWVNLETESRFEALGRSNFSPSHESQQRRLKDRLKDRLNFTFILHNFNHDDIYLFHRILYFAVYCRSVKLEIERAIWEEIVVICPRSMEKSSSNQRDSFYESTGVRLEWHFHVSSDGNCIPNRDTDWMIFAAGSLLEITDVCHT